MEIIGSGISRVQRMTAATKVGIAMNNMLFNIAVRNIVKYRKRSIIVLMAVSFSILFFVLAVSLIKGMENMFHQKVFENIGHIMVYREGYLKKAEMMPVDLIIEKSGKIKREITMESAVLSVREELICGGMILAGDNSLDMAIKGVDINDHDSAKRYRDALVLGEFLNNNNEAVIGKPVAKILRLKLRDKLVLMSVNAFGGVNAVELTVSGFFETDTDQENMNLVFISLSKARELLQIEEGATVLTIALKDHELTKEVMNKLSYINARYGVEMFSWEEAYKDLSMGMALVNTVLQILVFIVVIIVAIGIINTLLISFFERIRDIGTLRAIGMNKKQVLFLILIESGVLGICGAVLGVFLGGILVAILAKTGMNMGEQFNGLSRIIYPEFTATSALISLALGAFISILGALYPALLMTGMKPVKALSHR